MSAANPTPKQVAIADRVHARGRASFDALVESVATYPDSTNEVYDTTDYATMLWMQADCGHPECLDQLVRKLAGALAYAAVHQVYANREAAK